MSDAPPAEKKAIVGTLEEVSEKNGWTTFAIDVGSQYPVRLSTKLPALVEKGRAAGSQPSTWHFKESQGKENPNKPGTFYTNRYFDDVEIGVENADAVAASNNRPAQAPKAQAHHNPLAEPDKQRVISRLSCMSSAATLLQHASFDSDGQRIAAWIAAAAAAERHIYRDIDKDEVPPEIPSSSGAETPPPPVPDIAAGVTDDPPFGGPDDEIPY